MPFILHNLYQVCGKYRDEITSRAARPARRHPFRATLRGSRRLAVRCLSATRSRTRAHTDLGTPMARGDVRIAATLACEECKRRNYQTNKSKRNNPERLQLRKYCRWCRSPHRAPRDALSATGFAVARNRKRAKERRSRQAVPPAASARPADHGVATARADARRTRSRRRARSSTRAPDVELADAQLALGRPELIADATAIPELDGAATSRRRERRVGHRGARGQASTSEELRG